MALSTYGHVIEELEARRPAEELIREARAPRVPSEFPQPGDVPQDRVAAQRKKAANRTKPSTDSNR
jgi:hypothetical protein